MTRIDDLNAVRNQDKAVVRPQLFRERTGLLQEDYTDLGKFIMDHPKLSSSQLSREMMRLRDRRVARWHVYTAPDDRIHTMHRNEQSVQMLTEEVPYKDMTSKKWGPAIWRKLKDGVLDTPGWDRLKITALWTDREKYYRLHRKLDDTTDKGRLAIDREMIKESRDVHEVDVQIPETNLEFQRMIKRFTFGPPLGVMSAAKPVAVIFEMDSWDKDALPWQLKVMNCDPAVPFIVVWNSWHIDKVSSAVRRDESLGQQMQRRITVYLDDDHCFGG